MLNGQLALSQNGTQRNDTYVSSRLPLRQAVDLMPADLRFVQLAAAYVRMFWFVDCQYVGMTAELQQISNYTRENQRSVVQVLVYASFDPLRSRRRRP